MSCENLQTMTLKTQQQEKRNYYFVDLKYSPIPHIRPLVFVNGWNDPKTITNISITTAITKWERRKSTYTHTH